MKLFALPVLALSLCASASFAKPPAPPTAHLSQPKSEPTTQTASNEPKAQTVIGRDGQDASHHCSAENPNIEYRDCVNASTRDANAKVRLV